jgi:hypothetical protein
VKEHNDNDDDINEIQKQLKTLLCVWSSNFSLSSSCVQVLEVSNIVN